MPAAPLVSVIVPAYNAQRYLADALGSALRQTREKLEVIVVNDGSTDGTGELAQSLAASDPRVRVLHKENGGPSSARNAGLACARGELLCFLDADDMLLPDKLERQAAFLDLFPQCKLVYSDHYLGDERLTPVQLERRAPPPVSMPELLACRNWFAPMSPLLRTELQRDVGGFDESLITSEDWDFWIRASEKAVFSYLPGPVGVYRTHPAQAHRDVQRMRTNQERVIRKHYRPGSERWRMARASLAWLDAERAWGDRSHAHALARMCQSVCYARSRRTLKNVVSLLGM